MASLEEQMVQVTRTIEKQVDSAIEQMDSMNVNDLADLRKKRIADMQKAEQERLEWLQNGHGQYEELPEEKQFFEIIKKSKNVVIHFYTSTSSMRCAIVDKHLKILAPKHLETRFVSLNAEKCPFLTEKLKIKTIPSIVLVQNAAMVDKIVGFTQLGNRDDFTTETLEWRIAQNEIIKYEGDLSTPPYLQDSKGAKTSYKKIRDSAYNRDDEDLDIEEYEIARESLSAAKVKQQTELTAEEEAELGLNDE